uniref:Uncharacterized protein n=1 Tax=Romanomermis culicivorax TaxID=13658 RepID=A0A915LAP7_ROMCU
MLAQTVRRALNLHHDRVMQQPVEQGCCNDTVAEYLAPLTEAAIGSQDNRAPLIAGVDQLEEQVAAV